MVVIMQLISYRTKAVLALSFLWLGIMPAFASVGTISEQQGPNATLVRKAETLIAKKGAELEMQDSIETAKTKLNLTFKDNTKVAVTEQSKFVIDEFIYDPNANTGKLSMRVAMGTVRYASGGIAKNNRENVRLRTPTATISVRGTDFAMTVDEIGRSMVTLLPSCPDYQLPKNEDDCPVGEISVSTDAGMVIMNQAYQATVVSSSFQQPTKPRILTDRPAINNLLIISPPEEFPKGFSTTTEDDQLSGGFLDFNALDADELLEDLLAANALDDGTREIDRDNLEQTYLSSLLDIFDDGLGDAMQEYDGVLPTIHKYPWVKGSYNEENVLLYSDRPPHIADITTERDVNATVQIIQDDVNAKEIQVNSGENVLITIKQYQ